MTFFQISKDRAVLSVNDEYTNYEYLFAHQGKKMTTDDVRKAKATHGVSIIEPANMNSNGIVNKNGHLNCRITTNTEMEITGPAAGHQLLKTTDDPTANRHLTVITPDTAFQHKMQVSNGTSSISDSIWVRTLISHTALIELWKSIR
ncbi:Putative phosphatase [Photobacterium marinum]|uniref:Putative phosphatase n=1 Tax=Photobacterium marinum TaxID=1056511 RepID=L8JEZ4_9GAMM|nr:Putative phosphatase [Photobacterium marinum]